MEISYHLSRSYALDEVIGLYERSTLGERRPVRRPEIMRRMLEEADLLVFARAGETLVGLARTLTDFAYFITLLAAPVAQDYYTKVGFTPHPRAWWRAAPESPLEGGPRLGCPRP